MPNVASYADLVQAYEQLEQTAQAHDYAKLGLILANQELLSKRWCPLVSLPAAASSGAP